MQEKSWQKFSVLFSLYIAQSIPMSFFSTVVPVIMRQENYSLESIGLLQLVKLPWIFKFLWAPMVDKRTRSTRDLRKWIILSELFYGLVILSIGLFSLKTDFTLIIILMVVAFIASATQDIATDAYAILILRHKERSMGNSMQSAGSFVGSLAGTGVLLVVYYYLGWTVLLMLLAAFTVFALVPVFIYKRKNPVVKNHHAMVSLRDVASFFKTPTMKKRLLVLLTYYAGIIGILAMLKPYMVDLGYSVKEIGFMSGILGTSVAAGFSFLSGYIIKLFGRKTSMYLFLIINILVAVYFRYISLDTPSLAAIYFGICMLWGAYGLSSVAIYTTSMDVVRKGREGTDFTLQIVLTHLSGLIVAVLSGRLGDQLGYTGLFSVEIFVGLFALLMLIIYQKNEK